MDDLSVQKYIDLIDKIKGLKFLENPDQFILLTSPVGDRINPTENFDEDAFRSYLIDMRKVISLQDSETYFYNVCNYIHRNNSDATTKNFVSVFRKMYTDTLNDPLYELFGIKWVRGEAFA